MIAVLAYWLFLFAFFLPAGILAKKLLRITLPNLPVTLLLGMTLSTFAFALAAFVAPLNQYTFCVFSTVIAFTAYRDSKEIKLLLQMFAAELKSMPRLHVVLLSLLAAAASLKSAQLPSIVDNESYYIQTIKWLNEYGFVKGLANLHLFLGQNSGWHVLQAGLNLNFVSDRVNDLNGFLFLVCISFCFIECQRRQQLHWISLFAVFSAAFFLFIDSPSPDLPVIMIIPIILHLYCENATVGSNFRTAFALFVFVAFVKVTIAPVALLFLCWPGVRRQIPFVLAVGIPALLIWIGKNIILTGYPLYPMLSSQFNVEWLLPAQVPAIIHHMSNIPVYGATDDRPFINRLWIWFMKDGMDGLMNKLAVALFILMPMYRQTRQNPRYRAIYICFLGHFLILLAISPQFRFFLPEMLFFCAFIGSELLNMLRNRRKLYDAGMIAGCLVPVLLLFWQPEALRRVGRATAQTNIFRASQILLPEPGTAFPDMVFEERVYIQLRYYSPHDNRFIYGTGNGPLPCVNEHLLLMQIYRTHWYPQPLSESPGDGFRSVPTEGD